LTTSTSSSLTTSAFFPRRCGAPPERAHAEQTMNAHFLHAEGCGTFASLETVEAGTIREFLGATDRFAVALAERRGRMDGFPTAARAIAELVDRETGGGHAGVAAAA
jgi:hypothetical protein